MLTTPAEYRQWIEEAYGSRPYSKTRRARLYRKLFGRWPERVVNERMAAKSYADARVILRRKGLGW